MPVISNLNLLGDYCLISMSCFLSFEGWIKWDVSGAGRGRPGGSVLGCLLVHADRASVCRGKWQAIVVLRGMVLERFSVLCFKDVAWALGSG